jgi:hypothetical protein
MKNKLIILGITLCIVSSNAAAGGNQAEEAAREKRKEREVRDTTLDTLQYQLDHSQYRMLRDKYDIEYFCSRMLGDLDYLQKSVELANNNKAALREIAEAKSHLESIRHDGPRKLDTAELRKQFKRRLQKFFTDIRALVDKLP